MKLPIKLTHPNAKPPVYSSAGAACFDLHAATVNGAEHLGSNVTNGYPVTCDTGLSVEIPTGWAMLIFSRSGQGFNYDTRLANCVGVIDSDYRGTIKVKLTCDDPDDGLETKVPLYVKPGDRIAQAMLVPVEKVEFIQTDDLSDTERGANGFGSTGA